MPHRRYLILNLNHVLSPWYGMTKLDTRIPYLYTALEIAVEGTYTNTRFLPHKFGFAESLKPLILLHFFDAILSRCKEFWPFLTIFRKTF